MNLVLIFAFTSLFCVIGISVIGKANFESIFVSFAPGLIADQPVVFEVFVSFQQHLGVLLCASPDSCVFVPVLHGVLILPQCYKHDRRHNCREKNGFVFLFFFLSLPADTSNGSDHHHYQNKQIPQGPEDLLFSFQTAGNEFCQLIAPDEIYQGCQNADRQNGCCPIDFPAFFIIHILEKIPQRYKRCCHQTA